MHFLKRTTWISAKCLLLIRTCLDVHLIVLWRFPRIKTRPTSFPYLHARIMSWHMTTTLLVKLWRSSSSSAWSVILDHLIASYSATYGEGSTKLLADAYRRKKPASNTARQSLQRLSENEIEFEDWRRCDHSSYNDDGNDTSTLSSQQPSYSSHYRLDMSQIVELWSTRWTVVPGTAIMLVRLSTFSLIYLIDYILIFLAQRLFKSLSFHTLPSSEYHCL